MKTSDFIKQLDIRFDVYSLKQDWWNLVDSGALKTMISPKCKQIGLTHTKDCKEDTKWSQGVGSLYWDENYGFVEKDFSVVNETFGGRVSNRSGYTIFTEFVG